MGEAAGVGETESCGSWRGGAVKRGSRSGVAATGPGAGLGFGFALRVVAGFRRVPRTGAAD